MTDRQFNKERIKGLELRLESKIKDLDSATLPEQIKFLEEDIQRKIWKLKILEKIKIKS